eukprot:2781604-Amphidinium_carterae.2
MPATSPHWIMLMSSEICTRREDPSQLVDTKVLLCVSHKGSSASLHGHFPVGSKKPWKTSSGRRQRKRAPRPRLPLRHSSAPSSKPYSRVVSEVTTHFGSKLLERHWIYSPLCALLAPDAPHVNGWQAIKGWRLSSAVRRCIRFEFVAQNGVKFCALNSRPHSGR